MKDIKSINIAFSFDYNYYRQGVIAISSLLDVSPDISYNIYCFISSDVTSDVQEEMTQIVHKKSPQSSITYINMNGKFDNAFEIRDISKAAYYRLMLHRLVPIDKIIYSDVDVLFGQSLKEVDAMDIEPYYWGGVNAATTNIKSYRDELCQKYEYWRNELKNIGGNYKNSGFLVLNLKKWRETDFDNKIFEMSQKEYLFQDQDILNILFAERQKDVLSLPPRCNYITGKKSDYQQAIKEGLLTQQEYEEAVNNPIAIHYAGMKPWNDKTVELSEKWWNYVKKETPYYGYFKNRYEQLVNRQRHFEYRYHFLGVDILSKQRKNNKNVYRIMGIKFAL